MSKTASILSVFKLSIIFDGFRPQAVKACSITALVIALRPSEKLQAQISDLLEKHRERTLTAREIQMWKQYQYLEHLIRKAKTKAYLKLKKENKQ